MQECVKNCQGIWVIREGCIIVGFGYGLYGRNALFSTCHVWHDSVANREICASVTADVF